MRLRLLDEPIWRPLWSDFFLRVVTQPSHLTLSCPEQLQYVWHSVHRNAEEAEVAVAPMQRGCLSASMSAVLAEAAKVRANVKGHQ